jgi:hypothetical protein
LKKLECGKYIGGPADGKPVPHKILKNNSAYYMSLQPASPGDSGACASIYKRGVDSNEFLYVSTLVFPFELKSWEANHPGAFACRTTDGSIIVDPPPVVRFIRSMPGMLIGSFLILNAAVTVILLEVFKSGGKGN